MSNSTIAMTRLDPALSQRLPLLGKTTPQLWQAVSADHVWLYERHDGAGTPWQVTHRPTGMSVEHGSERAARRWTADTTAALDQLRRVAAGIVRTRGYTSEDRIQFVGGLQRRVEQDPAEAAQRLAVATRWLEILDSLSNEKGSA